MASKVINNINGRIDAYAKDDTQKRAMKLSIIFTGILWFILLVILGFSPAFQKKEKYKTVRIQLEPVVEKQLEKAETAPAAQTKPAEKPAEPKPAAAKPVEQTKPAQKTESAQAKPAQSPKPAAKPQASASKPAQSNSNNAAAPKKANIQYKKSNEELMEEQMNSSSKSSVNWDDVFSDENTVTSTSSAPVTGQKAISGSSALGGNAASAASANSSVKATSESKATKAASSSTTSQLNQIAKTQAFADPWLDGPVTASTNVVASRNNNGKYNIQLADGSTRELLEPSKPVIMISDENAKLIDSSRKVIITFRIQPSGMISQSTIMFTPEASLPESIRAEIRSQISKWRFSAAANDGQARFEYNVVKK